MFAKTLIAMALAVATSATLYAFDDKDTTDDDNLFSVDFTTGIYLENPYMSLSYGMAQVHRDGFGESVDPMPEYTLRFGTERRGQYRNSNILETRRSGLSAAFLNAQPNQGTNGTDARTQVGLWTFSLDGDQGYGYPIGDGGASIMLSHGGGATWGWLDRQSMHARDTQLVVDFGRAMRFGERSSAGIQFRVNKMFSIDGGADWTLIYPRHLFWQWAGSHVVEGIVDGVAAAFVRRVGRSSPEAVPVLHFLLRNGLAAGVKALRRGQMNWPFGANTAPLSVVSYRIGITAAF